MKFDIWRFFKNLSRKFKLHENRRRIKCTLHEDHYIVLSYIAHFFLEWEMFQTKVVEKIKTHSLCLVAVFWKSCRLWYNLEKKDIEGGGYRWHHGACAFNSGYIRLQIHALKLCNTHCFSTATMVARSHLIVTLYVHFMSRSVNKKNYILDFDSTNLFHILELKVCRSTWVMATAFRIRTRPSNGQN